MCVKALTLGSLIGGVILFVVCTASWMFLPFHMNSVKTFKNQGPVIQALAQQAPSDGVYLLPVYNRGSGSAEKLTAFIVPNFGGFLPSKDIPKQMVTELLTHIGAALFLTAILLNTNSYCLKKAAKVSLWVASLLATVQVLPYWNWFHFPLDFLLPGAIDTLIGTLLAGIAIAKFALPQERPAPTEAI
jgi:hypothetical protein